MNNFSFTPYHYRAKVLSIYDGDTVKLEVELGFHITVEITFRLARINAPELKLDERPAGLASRDWLRHACPVDSTVYLKTDKDKTGKYGRFITEIYIQGADTLEGDLYYLNINDELVRTKNAVYKAY